MSTLWTRRDFIKLSTLSAGGLAGAGSLRWLPSGTAIHKGTFVPLSELLGVACPDGVGVVQLQSPWLGMIGLGDSERPGGLAGNHLRWAFEPSLGFPPNGFALYRRPHQPAQPTRCAVPPLPEAGPTGRPPALELGRRIEVEGFVVGSAADMKSDRYPDAAGIDLRGHAPLFVWPAQPCRRVTVEVVDFAAIGARTGRSSIGIVAYDRGTAVGRAQTSAASGAKTSQSLDVTADRIDLVVVDAPDAGLTPQPMDGVFVRVCAAPIGESACLGSWTPLNAEPICLPLSAPNYPSPCQLASRAHEWPIARRRLPPGVWQQPDEPAAFTDLRDVLSDVYNLEFQPGTDVATDDASCPPQPAGNETPPTLVPDPLGLALLSSVDPDIARVLGLYWVDGPLSADERDGVRLQIAAAADDRPFDYLVIGDYGAESAGAATCATWQRAETLVGSVERGPLRYAVPKSLAVVSRGGAFALAIPDTKIGPVRITLPSVHATLPRPVRAVELHIDLDAGGRACARALSRGVVVDTADSKPSSDGGPAVLLVVAENIDIVELDGVGIYLKEVCFYQRYLPGGRIGWIAHNIVLGRATPLSVPTGLAADPRPAATRAVGDGADGCVVVAASMAAAVRWNRPPEAGRVIGGGPVVYDVERQPLGSGPSADAPTAAGWRTVRTNVFVADPSEPRCDPPSPLPGWPIAAASLFDVPPDVPTAGTKSLWYGYRVRGRDVFGRESDFGAPVTVDLGDSVAPPPPADVRARYLDPDDSDVDAAAAAFTHPPGGPRHGVRVGWRWHADLREQAPDAVRFEVFYRPGRLNVVVGRITAVAEPTPDGDGPDERIVLTTDLPVPTLPGLPEGIPDAALEHAYAGEWLSQHDQLFQVIDSGFGGGRVGARFVTLTVRRRALPPVPIPRDPSLPPPPVTDRFLPPVKVVYPELQPRPAVGPFSLSLRAAQPFVGTVTETGGPLVGDGLLVDLDDETATVDTDVRYTGAPNSLAGLRLRQGTTTWEITGNGSGWGIYIAVRKRPCAPVVPERGAGFALVEADGVTAHLLDRGSPLWRDFGDARHWTEIARRDVLPLPSMDTWSADVAITPPPPLAMPLGEPEAYGAVAVRTVDSHGNPGPLSGPIVVVRANRAAPPPCEVPTVSAVLWATPADFAGRSFFTVRWLRRGAAPGVRYRVFRALIDDRPEAPAIADPWMQVTRGDLTPEEAADFDEPTTRFAPGHRADAGLLAYRDTLDGRSSSRYRYRVQTVSAAGVAGAMSADIGPVACPDVVGPAAPVVTAVVGGDRAIRIRWVPDGSASVDAYWVYRTERADNAADVRRMSLLATVAASAAICPDDPDGRCWTDTTVVAYCDHFYRLVAVTAGGRTSPPSDAFRAAAYDYGPPPVPAWERIAWVRLDKRGAEYPWSAAAADRVPAVVVSVTVPYDHVSALLQHEEDGGWRAVTPWSSPQFDAARKSWRITLFDAAADPGRSHRYRLLLITSAGVRSDPATATIREIGLP